MKILCKAMGIQRSSFYAWKKHLSHPSEREKNLVSNVRLFQEYHLKYPSHGYHWLNAKIGLDKNIVLSDPMLISVARLRESRASPSITAIRRLEIRHGYSQICSCQRCRLTGRCSAS